VTRDEVLLIGVRGVVLVNSDLSQGPNVFTLGGTREGISEAEDEDEDEGDLVESMPRE